MSESQNNKKKQKKALLIIAILLVVIGLGFFAYHLYGEYSARRGQEEVSSVVASTTAAADEKTVSNPIDFKSLQKKNSDIYAWIKVPGTKVDYPIVQSPDNDELYLKHSAIDKSWIASGAIYTELVNSTDFDDRVTLIYGHNGYKDTMFTTLHKFEKKEFFDKHEYFYIYTPESKLTYKILSAFKYDDRHIMYSFDFQNNAEFLDFIKMIQNPSSNNKNTRQEQDKEYTTDDRIVVLSTCITNQRSSRYLVCGVLEKNEKTN